MAQEPSLGLTGAPTFLKKSPCLFVCDAVSPSPQLGWAACHFWDIHNKWEKLLFPQDLRAKPPPPHPNSEGPLRGWQPSAWGRQSFWNKDSVKVPHSKISRHCAVQDVRLMPRMQKKCMECLAQGKLPA